MTFNQIKTIFVGILFATSFAANANVSELAQKEALWATELRVVGSALEARDEMVQAIEQRDFTQVAHSALDKAIRGLEQELRAKSELALADELILNWEGTSYLMFGSFGTKDIGDHAPLFQWIEDFFLKLEDRLGTAVVNSLPYVADIRTLNFALPVVFKPQGTWQQAVTSDPRIEYRKHFIPFANIATYYTSYFGCLYFVKQQGLNSQFNKLCQKAADKLKFVMGRYIAPSVSDFVFKGANPNYKVPSQTLRYRTADELRSAI